MISYDNSALRQKVYNSLDAGKKRYQTGESFDEKEKGMYQVVEGLKNLRLWIERESDPTLKEKLRLYYNQNVDEVEKMKKFLEDNKIAASDPANGQMMRGGKGSGGKKDDDENEKFKKSLSEAIVSETPNVKWDDIAGLENAKKSLQEAVILPIKFPHIFQGVRKPWKGILMYGPPGTGKTFLAKACATEASGTFFSISSSDLISKYVGESEKLIKTLFQMAREKAPSIIFIDEVDSLCGARGDNENEASRRVKTEFLVQMQGVGSDNDKLLVLGATNLPWALDPAIRRRFEKRIYIPLPDETARKFMFQHCLKDTPNSLTDPDFAELAKRSEGYSGADISILVRDAVMEPVRKCQLATAFKRVVVNGKRMLEPVFDETDVAGEIVQTRMIEIKGDELHLPDLSMKDFVSALCRSKPSVSKDQLGSYEEFTQNFGQEGQCLSLIHI
eukprot:TRINITY_DN6795_c0_g1_i2.p1 TRINITY_DN6795_c0_g1~~TRINITY_DN6795_c0_g1_i2.p1  ORF type:complete len:446 (+),score=98.00 TRINITY_DN6795_c0_g1_i2:146-1483(+)